MSVDEDDVGWEVDSDDESSAIAELIGRQIKRWREAAGLRAVEFGERMGYGENLIHKVERGARIPRPEFLDRADEVLNAAGHLRGLKPDAERARYPKKVRDLAKVEQQAVEVCTYNNSVIHGLLQTQEYAEAEVRNRQPPFPEDEVERRVAGRMARQGIVDNASGLPVFGFVQCESTLRRSNGGRMVMRRQLERLLEVGQLRNVSIQVLPLDREENAGLGGPLTVFKLKNGTTLGHLEVQLISRVITDLRELQTLEMRYGMIRAQALTPRESLAFIEKVRGET
ncbi:helix-turn-helix domain-containing protein [Streptomyces aureoverticillatus]|uniref:helix-turn-helix domain-containing protein n=1 Tax=Streptomyces aureoverticillatus TaxID=66871 RepID=UPI0013DCA9C8|nr:helix-turn-helix transcriptional regulator [Streptomyces aureoverticillatus]QIB43999.1 helix-turn-helix domain-containing protein [Streptomyces aureoverticillatus]